MKSTIAVSILCVVAHTPALAGGGLELDPEYSIDARIWHSTGYTKWSHNASVADPAVGNPTSSLDYANVDATVVELRGRARFSNRFFVELGLGVGAVDGGRLMDDDLLSAGGADLFDTTVTGAHVFSRTDSTIAGDEMLYVDLIIARRLRDGRFSVFGEFLGWVENLRGREITQVICTAPGRLCPPAGSFDLEETDVIKNQARWYAFFVGVKGSHSFNSRVTITGSIAASPFVLLDSDDFHLLRTDLRRPGFNMTGLGYGINADLNLSYGITPKLSVHLGFRYWKLRVSNDVNGWRAFLAGGGTAVAELNEFVSERKGMILGLSYLFDHK